MVTEARAKMTAEQVTKCLVAQYKAPEWAVFEELRCGTGFSNDQRLDLWVMHTWPSHGLRTIAFEVKVSRSDFMREIEQPAKRKFAETVSAEAYFATPAGLVKPDEVPEGWGLKVVNAAGHVSTLKAPTQRPAPALPPTFVASLVRRSADATTKAPGVAWMYMGKELNEEALIKIAEATLKTTIDGERKAIGERAVRTYRDTDPDYRTMLQTTRHITSVTGLRKPTYEELRDWVAAQHGAMPRDLVALIESLRPHLNWLQSTMAQIDEAIRKHECMQHNRHEHEGASIDERQ